MSPYVHDAQLSYATYLQGGAAAEPREVEFPPHVASLLGSPTPPSGWPLPVEPTHVLEWGGAEELLEMDVFNIPLVDLKNQAKTSAGMWAMEQFDLAREALRHSHPRDAFAYLERALHGNEKYEGYEADFRCHFLLGLIHLGTFRLLEPALLDLAKAKQCFLTAARYAAGDYPIASVIADLAAGWCEYCQGNMDEALHQTEHAIVLDPHSAAAQYQSAKIRLHRRETEAARPLLSQAITLNPAYAAMALRDGDFVPFTSLVLELLEAERDHVGRRASEALKSLTALANSLAIDLATLQAPEETGASIAVLVDAANAAFRENTLFGYLRSEVAAGVATQAVQGLRRRLIHEQSTALELIETAKHKLAETAALHVGPYRLSLAGMRQLDDVRSVLREADAAYNKQTLGGYIDAANRARGAIALLRQTADSYRDSALQHATAACEALEGEIAELRRKHSGRDSPVKAFAFIGAIVALFPGGFFSFFSVGHGGMVSWSNVALRVCLYVALFAIVGAVFGALLAPMFHPEQAVVNHELETRRTALKQTIAELHALAKGA